jgi:hypothetical protein
MMKSAFRILLFLCLTYSLTGAAVSAGGAGGRRTMRLVKTTKGGDIKIKAGGWGSSGGGSGVACFNDESTALKADIFIQQGLPLPSELKKQITKLETLDYWDWKQTKPFELIEPKSKNYKEILNEMHAHAGMAIPILIFRLEQTSQLIEPADWNGMSALPRIYDAKPTKAIDAHCRQVQLAARYTKETYTSGTGPSLYKPIIKVDVDQDLFAMLTPLDQAILVTHERAYMLGQTTGHNDSDIIRPFVMRLFQKDFDHRKLRYDLVMQFGDYALYFGEDFKVKGAPGSQGSRFNSFYELLLKVRKNIGDCSKRKNLPAQIKTQEAFRELMACKDEAMNPIAVQAWSTDEMSFIFISYFVFDRSSGMFNSEVLVAPLKNPEFEALAKNRLNESCNAIKYEFENDYFVEMKAKAINYCNSLGL